MVDEIKADVAIVGAGMAGVGLAANLVSDFNVVLIEQEKRPGYHSTGRSVATFIQNYGNSVIRALNQSSAILFRESLSDKFPTPLLSQRGILYVSDEAGLTCHEALMAEANGLKEISPAEALAKVPLLRQNRIAAAAYEHDAQDIDVDVLHQGWLRKTKEGGGRLLTDAPLAKAEFRSGEWVVDTPKAVIRAAILVNAAGAWADRVASLSGVAPIGIQPMRRSVAVLPTPEGCDIRHWPMVGDSMESWYAKPEAGRLLVSPAEEIPVEPHDAFVDDMILAEGLYRFEQAVDFPVTRVEHSWAGLRSFTPDRSPVAGYDPTAEKFFWLAGHGGYGIQTAPALSRLAGRLIRRASGELESLDAALSPSRFRSRESAGKVK